MFLDRDGTLNALVQRDGAGVSPRRLEEFRVLSGAAEAAAQLRALGFLVFVTSNQPDVARGTLEAAELERMTAALRAAVPVDEVVVCPHDDRDACPCRKPKPGMLTDLAARWNVNLAASFMVGDSWKDMAAGRAAGCRTIYIGPPEALRDAVPDGMAGSLPAAVAQIATAL